MSYDWSGTVIGPIDNWPTSLVITLGNILHSSFPMFLFWGDDLLCFYNDAYRPSLGIDGKHPAIGRKGSDIWPEIWDFIGPIISQVMTTGKAVWFEDQLLPIYRNGNLEEVYWTFSYSPAFGDDYIICGVLVTCMETTQAVLGRQHIAEIVEQRTVELKNAQYSLLQANHYLQNIINLFQEPLQVLEPIVENGEIIDFCFKITNNAYSAYANVTPADLQNKKVSEFFPGYFQTSSFVKVAEVFTSGVANTWDLHYNVDGLDLHNRMSATKLDTEVVVHFTDFTEVKRLQQELESKITELERSNQHLEEFVHAASHDLKEPIRKILVFNTVLKKQLTNRLQESELATFERIEKASHRMESLINDLLLFSHVSQVPHEKEDIDLNETIKQVMEDLDLDIQQKQVIIKTNTLPVVKGYRRQLQQLFQNLISNSIKYGHSERQVEIVITAGPGNDTGQKLHLIEIADNGIGFEQHYADKIFQMFTRLHGKSEYSGSGVGLAIVKKVIENHKGAIIAESKPGHGSTFKVMLPA